MLKLTGITRSDKFYFCWWDADGQPISLNNWILIDRAGQPPVKAIVEVSGTPDEWKKQSPTGKPMRNMGGKQTGDYQATEIFTVNDGKLKVGIPVGDWQKIGEIKPGGSIKIDTVTYRMRQPLAQASEEFYLEFYPNGNSSTADLVALTAVGVDGTELNPMYLKQIVGENNSMSIPQFEGMALAKLKSFNVWKRKRQWVTFEGFAIEPVIAPPTHAN